MANDLRARLLALAAHYFGGGFESRGAELAECAARLALEEAAKECKSVGDSWGAISASPRACGEMCADACASLAASLDARTK